MDLDDTQEQADYRAQVRSWLDEHKSEAPVLDGPDAIKDESEIIAARRAWQGKLAEGGLAGVTWPKDFGGQGLGPIEQVISNQEIAKAKLPGILDAIGVGMLGPTIIAHGTDEQKTRYLGAMLHGDEVWCQLFSEPAAGSDLAAVQTRARLQDDGSWRISGQKVWTTNAQFASYGLLLARTDADVPKHKGLTMFIVPIDAPGVTVRGLRQISGEAEFNEVFFDDLAVDGDAVVGGVGNGWGTALTTLMFERVTIGLGSEGMGYNSTRFAGAIAADEHARRDPEVRHQLGEIASEMLAVRFTGYRTLSALQKGQVPGPESGLAKITIVSGAIKAGDLIADVLGPDALAEDGEWAYMISFLPGLKSAGG
ncbi:MAG TPA: acyl-CoA dehydrogenase family protein, partial [Solirubrobacteraceae bacterium]|nr:acyl-CoA dehydrogenase family protein [Solirubrobacteraceae bacterium]